MGSQHNSTWGSGSAARSPVSFQLLLPLFLPFIRLILLPFWPYSSERCSFVATFSL